MDNAQNACGIGNPARSQYLGYRGAAMPPAMVRTAALRCWLLLLLALGGLSAATAQPNGNDRLVPVSHRVHIDFTPVLLNKNSGLFETNATARNDSKRAVSAPLRLVITKIEPESADVANAKGKDKKGRPYLDFALINGALRSGETTPAIQLQFRAASLHGDKHRRGLHFRYRMYAASVARNTPPVANAGLDQTVAVGATATLDGSGSSDSDGDALTYRWSIVRSPESSQSGLVSADTVHPGLAIDQSGEYEINLVVNDGKSESTPDSVVISTVNSKPVADAGPDQTVFVGTRTQLDGTASLDRDGDTLGYRWTLKSKPATSLAELLEPDTATPGFQVDKPGRYEAELTVDDGVLASEPDTMFVDTENSRPVAAAGADQTAELGSAVRMDGSHSSDADGDTLGFAWSLISTPSGSQAQLTDSSLPEIAFTPDLPGSYIAQLVVDDGRLSSAPDNAEITVTAAANRAPRITSSPPLTAIIGQSYSYAVEAHDPDGDRLNYSLQVSPAGLVIDPFSGVIRWPSVDGPAGLFPVRVKADDGRGGADLQSFELAVQLDASRTIVPGLIGLLRPVAEIAILDAGLRAGNLRFETNPLAEGTVVAQDPAAGGVVARGTEIGLVISLGPDPGLPPDPGTVAPRLDATTPTTTAAATAFLFSGANSVQTGVAANTMEPKRAAVIRGRVTDSTAAPLPAVVVTVKDHGEYGQTLTRSDGGFDLAVNGGGSLVLNFRKQGYLPAQRQANPVWQEYAAIEDVALADLDPVVSAVTLGPDAPMQTAHSSVVSDKDGVRQATALFPAGLQAAMTLPDGTLQTLSNLTVRATEYTVGDNGLQSMPGPLPPSSGYTYAVELSADEALAAGAETVRFDRPVPVYVDNFLGFPVGMPVPAGYYDRQKAAWVPSENGRVIRLISIADGLADIDADGDGAADDAIKRAALGVTEDERSLLAQRFEPGTSFWRVPVTHFTPWDFNWPYGPPSDAKAPLQPAPRVAKGLDDPDCQSGSIIECQTQTLGEALAVAGTPFTLNYRSDRTEGRKTAQVAEIVLTGSSIPASLKRVELEIEIAGRRHIQAFPATANQSTRFTWDGLDSYGRRVAGTQTATVRIGYVYDAVYQAPANLGNAFAAFSGVPMTGSRARRELILWQIHKTRMGSWNALPLGFGSWSLNIQHVYDPNERVLYRGDGGRQSADAISSSVITTVAGGCTWKTGDVNAVTNACMSFPLDVAVTPDGGFYISDGRANTIRYVSPDGTIRRAVGGQWGFAGDGGPATEAKIYSPQGISLGADGSLYFADWGNHRIRRVDPKGIISTVAGNGTPGYSGDGVPATEAQLASPEDVAAAPDGSLYIADTRNSCVRKVSPGGVITNVTAYGTGRYFKVGLPAREVQLDRPGAVAVANDGTLYISATSNHSILQVGLDGVVRMVAGNGGPAAILEGVPATQSYVHHPFGVAVGPDRSIYFATENRLRRVGPDGIINTVVGNGKYADDMLRDGGPPLQAGFRGLFDSAVGPDGSVYVVDADHQRVRKVSPSLPGSSIGETIIPSKDGSEVYIFDQGRHVRTLDALNKAVIHTFTYDARGLLTSVTDIDGLVTTIERDTAGNATAIVAPFGQRTELSLDAHGYLASVTTPGPATYQMAYSAEGLLIRFVDPEGHASGMAYDDLGRLIEDKDALGGAKSLSRNPSGNAYTVSLSSPLGRSTRYLLEEQPTGTQKRRTTLPDGSWRETLIAPGGERATSMADGTLLETTPGGDPRFGMQAPILTSRKLTKGGLTQTVTRERTVTLANNSDPFSLTKQTDKFTVNGRLSTRVYDAMAKTITLTTPGGRSGQVYLDAAGRVLQSEVPGILGTANAFDAHGRLVKQSRGSGADERSLTLSYSDNGYLASVTDSLGRTLEYGYDAAGHPIRQTLPDGREIGFAYDRNGNVLGLTPPGLSEHRFSYNPVNFLEQYQPPAIGEGGLGTGYEYDLDRKPTRIIRPDGLTLDFAYDTGGRLSSVTTPEGNSDYRFDSATGKLIDITTADGVVLGYTHNGGLPTKSTWSGPISGSVGYSYDNDFRVTTVTLNDANPVTYQYDADSLLVKAGDLSFSRNAQNGLVTGTVLGSTADTLQYNGFGEVTDYQAKANGADLFAIRFAYDKGGRVVSRTETQGAENHTFEYSYDLSGRLVETKKDGNIQETYGYDANGNRTRGNSSEIAHFDVQDRLLDAGSTHYAYNANGELRSRNRTGAITAYRYDVLGNLKAVELPSGDRIDYVVDGANRRIGKKVNGTLVRGWLYQDALKPVAELDGSGTVLSRFIYATHDNVPDYLIKGGNTYRLFTDHLGSPRLVVNAADGTVIQRMEYDAWGRVTDDSNPGFQPFGFAGGLYDRDTGLVRFGARDYDPETGRFTAKDPILFAGGSTNLYGYVLNDPVNLHDPTGNIPIPAIWAAFTALMPLIELEMMAADDLPGLGIAGGRCQTVTHQIPSRMARVIPAEFAEGSRLAGPNALEAWVTGAQDLAGISTSEGVAKRLTLVDETGRLIPGARAIIEFDAPVSGIASPVFRSHAGFLQGGLTRGGAREFILPNLRLDELSNLSIRIIR